MPATLTPMIAVPDVRATALWYRSIGFAIEGWHACDSDAIGHGTPPDKDEAWDWASVRYGNGRVMFNAGGRASDAHRREVDLYLDVEAPPAGEGVDALHAALKDRVEMVNAPYETFYGNRELIIRDLNGFWITFAQPARD